MLHLQVLEMLLDGSHRNDAAFQLARLHAIAKLAAGELGEEVVGRHGSQEEGGRSEELLQSDIAVGVAAMALAPKRRIVTLPFVVNFGVALSDPIRVRRFEGSNDAASWCP